MFSVTIVDLARPFSPSQIPPPDLTSPWEERQVGGLGWHLIQEMMDEVTYHPNQQAGNRLTLRKRLPPAAPP
jgi:serine/threonine-protein kinase RsbW